MAIASWRAYLTDINQRVTHQSDKALLATLDQNDENTDLNLIAMEDQQELSQIEGQLIDVIEYSDSTADTNTELTTMYEQHQRWKSTDDTDKLAKGAVFDTLGLALQQKSKEIIHTRKIAEARVSKTKSSRVLISSFLDLQNALSLRQIQIESGKESTAMRDIAEKGQRDSRSLKVLSIITMIYLPCTIVASFYSSQFVYQVELDGDMVFAYSSGWWLFFAISIPLTLLTMGIWHYWSTRGLYLQRTMRETCLNIRNRCIKFVKGLRRKSHEEDELPMS